MPNDTHWNKLKDMHAREEQAAVSFIQGCKSLGIDDKLLNDLRDELVCFPNDDVYEGLEPEPSLSGIRQVLKNLSTLGCESPVIENIRAKIIQLEESAKASRNSPAPQLTIAPTTYGYALIALLDVMAASSKLGLGTDDCVGMVDGAREFSRQLFADDRFLKIIKLLTFSPRGQQQTVDEQVKSRNFLVPLQFAFGVLLSGKVGAGCKHPQGLPKDLEEFKRIQATHFGDCLTQCSLEARNTYHEVLTTEGQSEDLGLNEELPAELKALAVKTRETSLQAISDRVYNFDVHKLGDPTDVDLARRWLKHSLKEEHLPAAAAAAAPGRS